MNPKRSSLSKNQAAMALAVAGTAISTNRADMRLVHALTGSQK